MAQYTSIRPGQKWYDTSGKLIQAHGFSVFRNEEDGLWYWYGENKEKTDGITACASIPPRICTTGRIRD